MHVRPVSLRRLIGADVRPGEGAIVFVFFLNLMLMMTAFYILKVISEPLILAEGGALTRSFARGIEAAIVIALLPAYVLLAQRFDPSRLVVWLDLSFAISLIGLAILASTDARIGLVFFVWLGIFGTLAIAQFWSLANDLFSQSQGLRLFPAVAVGGTLGGIAGAQLAAHGIKWLEPYELMLAADVLIAACVVLTAISRRHARRTRRAGAAQPASPPAPTEGPLTPRAGAWTRMLSDPYLLLIAASVLLLNVVNTTGEYILADLVSRRADEIARHASDAVKARDMYIASFYGNFRTIVSVVATALQLVLVSRVLKRSGLQQALMLLPLLAIASYGAAAVAPLLGTIVAVKVAENGADYSLSNTVRQALFLPTTRKAKYQAKTAIDMSLVRVGDLVSAALVALTASLSLGVAQLAFANMAIAMVWLVVNFKLAGRYRGVARARSAAGAG